MLHDRGYVSGLSVDWLPHLGAEEVRARLLTAKADHARKSALGAVPLPLPQRLWRSLASAAGVTEGMRWAVSRSGTCAEGEPGGP